MPCRISVYGANGALVREISLGAEQAGFQQHELDLSGLSAGAYQVTLQAGTAMTSKTLILR